MSTIAFDVVKASTSKISEFERPDLIQSINSGRIMHGGKECKATWSKGMNLIASASTPDLDEKAKAELAAAFSNNNSFIEIGRGKKSSSSYASSSSSSGNLSAFANDPFFAAFNKMAPLPASAPNNAQQSTQTITVVLKNLSNSSTWTLKIQDLTPDQKPLLGGGSTAPATTAPK